METDIGVRLSIIAAKPPLRALADVSIRWSDGQIVIRRCAVFQKSGEPPWASFPRLAIEKNGSKTFLLLVELPLDLKQRVFDAVLTEYRKRANEI
jgi:hypothetical protein